MSNGEGPLRCQRDGVFDSEKVEHDAGKVASELHQVQLIHIGNPQLVRLMNTLMNRSCIFLLSLLWFSKHTHISFIKGDISRSRVV